jgi:hypothetical protein
MPNGINSQTSSKHVQASNTDVRHWEELIDFIKKNCSPEAPYSRTVIYKYNLVQEVLDKEYMGLYTPRHIMNDPLYGQILYNSSLANAYKLRLGRDVKLFLVDIKAATGKDIAEHAIRPAKLIPASLAMVCCSPLLISILRVGRYPIITKEWWMRRQVAMGLIVLM